MRNFLIVCKTCGNDNVGMWNYHNDDYGDSGVKFKCPECGASEKH